MQFTLNGLDTEYSGDENKTLMEYLRLEAGIITPKDGCSSQGSCGCCMVQQNDRAVLSCLTP